MILGFLFSVVVFSLLATLGRGLARWFLRAGLDELPLLDANHRISLLSGDDHFEAIEVAQRRTLNTSRTLLGPSGLRPFVGNIGLLEGLRQSRLARRPFAKP